jgi:peptidoglycan DL-endopeptidase CwlO
MQFTPDTAKDYGIDPWSPEQSVDGAARFIAKWKTQLGSDELALAAYNAGPGNVQKAGNRVPKFPETQNYLAKVEANMRSAKS